MGEHRPPAAPGSGDPAVPAQPGSGSARLMGSAAALRRLVLIFPARRRRRRLSARPRCSPSPGPVVPVVHPPPTAARPSYRLAAGEGPRLRRAGNGLAGGARAVTPPRRDPGARWRPGRERAEAGGDPGDRAGPGWDA